MCVLVCVYVCIYIYIYVCLCASMYITGKNWKSNCVKMYRDEKT